MGIDIKKTKKLKHITKMKIRNKKSDALCENLTHSVNLSLGSRTRKVSYVTIFWYHLLNIFVKKDEKINR